ncbi:MAG: hypothetical protein V2A53_00610 [bacterium]
MRGAVALLSKEPTLLVGGVSLLRARREFRSLLERMLGEEALDLPLQTTERCQTQKMKEIMRLMLQVHINARGS